MSHSEFARPSVIRRGRPHNAIRLYATIFAVLLGLQGLWLVAAELARPALPFFPVDAAQAKAAASHSAAATASAWIGWPRGELWIDRAMSTNAALLGSIEEGAASNLPLANDENYAVAETAATLAPSDARAWLLLAILSEQSAPNTGKAQAQLKMSYYTAPYNESLFPLRIQIGARLAKLDDDELGGLIEYELGTIIRQRPNLKRTIASAFHAGSASGRQFLEAAIGKYDAKFLTDLQTTYPALFTK